MQWPRYGALARNDSPDVAAEGPEMQRVYRPAGDVGVLPAARRNLEPAHDGGERAGFLPVPSMAHPVQDSGPIRVAASGRVDDRGRFGGGNGKRGAAGMDDGAVASHRHDQRIDALGDRRERKAGPLG